MSIHDEIVNLIAQGRITAYSVRKVSAESMRAEFVLPGKRRNYTRDFWHDEDLADYVYGVLLSNEGKANAPTE